MDSVSVVQALATAFATVLTGCLGLIVNSFVKECIAFRKHIGIVGSTLFQYRSLLENIRTLDESEDKKRIDDAKCVCEKMKKLSADIRKYMVSIVFYDFYSKIRIVPSWRDALSAAEYLSLLSYALNEKGKDGTQISREIQEVFRLLGIARMYGK